MKENFGSRRNFIAFGVLVGLGVSTVEPVKAKPEADPEIDPVKYMDEFFWIDKTDPKPDDFSWVINDKDKVKKPVLGKIPERDNSNEKWPNTASPIPKPSLSENSLSDLDKAIRESVTVGGNSNPLSHGR